MKSKASMAYKVQFAEVKSVAALKGKASSTEVLQLCLKDIYIMYVCGKTKQKTNRTWREKRESLNVGNVL